MLLPPLMQPTVIRSRLVPKNYLLIPAITQQIHKDYACHHACIVNMLLYYLFYLLLAYFYEESILVVYPLDIIFTNQTKGFLFFVVKYYQKITIYSNNIIN